MLHYQPKIDLTTGTDGRRRGARPLAAPRARTAPAQSPSSRWSSGPTSASSSPTRCSRWRWPRTAAWSDMGLEVPVAVNLSRRSLLDPTLPSVGGRQPRRARRRAEHARPRDHRDDDRQRAGGRPTRSCASSAGSGSRSPWTTSAPATPRCPTSRTCRSTSSRSTGASSATSPTKAPGTRSWSGPPSSWHTTSGCPSWPRASRTPPPSAAWAPCTATWPRASTSPARCRPPSSVPGW